MGTSRKYFLSCPPNFLSVTGLQRSEQDFHLERYRTRSVTRGLGGHRLAGCTHAVQPQEKGTWTHSNIHLRSWTKNSPSNTETCSADGCPCVQPFHVQSLAGTWLWEHAEGSPSMADLLLRVTVTARLGGVSTV